MLIIKIITNGVFRFCVYFVTKTKSLILFIWKNISILWKQAKTVGEKIVFIIGISISIIGIVGSLLLVSELVEYVSNIQNTHPVILQKFIVDKDLIQEGYNSLSFTEEVFRKVQEIKEKKIRVSPQFISEVLYDGENYCEDDDLFLNVIRDRLKNIVESSITPSWVDVEVEDNASGEILGPLKKLARDFFAPELTTIKGSIKKTNLGYKIEVSSNESLEPSVEYASSLQKAILKTRNMVLKFSSPSIYLTYFTLRDPNGAEEALRLALLKTPDNETYKTWAYLYLAQLYQNKQNKALEFSNLLKANLYYYIAAHVNGDKNAIGKSFAIHTDFSIYNQMRGALFIKYYRDAEQFSKTIDSFPDCSKECRENFLKKFPSIDQPINEYVNEYTNEYVNEYTRNKLIELKDLADNSSDETEIIL